MLRLDDWVRQLAALVLLAGIAELLLPTGRMKAYARSLLGLLVLLGLLQPLVALLRGQISLELPTVAAAAGPSATGDGGTMQAAGHAYEGLVAGQVVHIADQVAGVQSASATVTFAADMRTPVGAQVQIAATTVGMDAGPALVTRVQSAVAAGLGLPAADVTVQEW
jgi:stage III sporulation protein AF